MSKWNVRSIAAQDTIQPNLIPMVDIMFLLLLFLMLGSDMGQRELEAVILPKGIYVKEDKAPKGVVEEQRTTINVYHLQDSGVDSVQCEVYAKRETCRNPKHWRIAVRGKDFLAPDDKKFKELLKDEADIGRKKKTDKVSERKIMLRADGSAPYSLVQGVMHSCAFAGIYKIECGAARVVAESAVK
ncbi:MAG: biopolymer transporter ExbD [Planctomycetota bacterium]